MTNDKTPTAADYWKAAAVKVAAPLSGTYADTVKDMVALRQVKTMLADLALESQRREIARQAQREAAWASASPAPTVARTEGAPVARQALRA